MNTRRHVLVQMLQLGLAGTKADAGKLAEEFEVFFGLSPEEGEPARTIEELIGEGLVTRDDEGNLRLTQTGRQTAHGEMIEFGFEEGYKRLAAGTVDKAYRRAAEERTGAIGMTSAPELEIIADELSRLDGPVVDIGCGDGRTTRHLAQRTRHRFVGVDRSPDVVELARSQTADGGPRFVVGDMNDVWASERQGFPSAVMIDSIYFAGETPGEEKSQKELAKAVYDHCRPGGGLVVTYSTFAPDDDTSSLDHNATPVARFAEEAGIELRFHDVTAPQAKLWAEKLETLDSFRDRYYGEKSAYMYWEARNEHAAIARLCGEGKSSRFVYVLPRR